MLAKEITVGGRYMAKVNNTETVVRVLAIRETCHGCGQAMRWTTRYDVKNERTGRVTVFRSPQKFRAAIEIQTQQRTTPAGALVFRAKSDLQ
jgi:hypothetical protein